MEERCSLPPRVAMPWSSRFVSTWLICTKSIGVADMVSAISTVTSRPSSSGCMRSSTSATTSVIDTSSRRGRRAPASGREMSSRLLTRRVSRSVSRLIDAISSNRTSVVSPSSVVADTLIAAGGVFSSCDTDEIGADLRRRAPGFRHLPWRSSFRRTWLWPGRRRPRKRALSALRSPSCQAGRFWTWM